MRALLAAFPAGDDLGSVALVISDNEGAPALAAAKDAGVTALHVPWGGRRDFEEQAQLVLDDHSVDLVCLAGFMRLLSARLVSRWEGRMLNVHPSLLPKHRGLHPHRQVLADGSPETGCSVHFVDAGMDTGKVIAQRALPVLPGDTEESLAERVLPLEHDLYPEAVRMVLRGEARP